MKLKMLIVEDNPLTSTLLSTIFSVLGFDVKELDRGDEALPYLAANEADVIILDLELPGMTGDEIYAGLKKDPKLQDIPVVPFTAHADPESETALPRKLIRTGVLKDHHVPRIVYKVNDGGDTTNITQELVDEITRSLMKVGKSIPEALWAYYKDTRGLSADQVKAVLVPQV